MQKVDTFIQRKLDSFAKTAYNSPSHKAEVIQLPLWPEPERGVPNAALRSALFAAVHHTSNEHLERKLVAVQKGFEIRYTGKQLCQSDLDVWEQAIHIARRNPLGDRCVFTLNAFLSNLGLSTGKHDREWLHKTLVRLTGSVVEITSRGESVYFGPLLMEGAKQIGSSLYGIRLNRRLLDLYEKDGGGWTAIDWEQRINLKRKPLALWLHGFFSSHAEPFPMKVETYRTLSGSQTKEKWKFKQNLKAALEELKRVGAIINYDFERESGLLYVERIPSSSQQRHLEHQTRHRR